MILKKYNIDYTYNQGLLQPKESDLLMKKNAFSYLELIICMSVVATVIMLSAPFLTGTSNKNSDIFGEFRCFSEYDATTDSYRLYQQQRYNSATLTAKTDVTDTGCIFAKPVGASSFTITLSGGGGGGASASINSLNSNFNQITELTISETNGSLNKSTLGALAAGASTYVKSSNCTSSYCKFIDSDTGFQTDVAGYKNKTIQKIIDVYPGLGGNAGETIAKTATLTTNFNADDAIVIPFCKNAQISSEETEERYCIGRGGKGGKAHSLSNYYTVAAILQDLVHGHKYPSLPYTGLGDGQINNYDLMNLKNAVVDDTAYQPISALETYLSSKTTANYQLAYTTLENILHHHHLIKRNDDSDGFDGEYTRFAISDTDNLVAFGGQGARTSKDAEHMYEALANENQSFVDAGTYSYYIRKGENGTSDSRIQINGGAQGGFCQCTSRKCTNCDGNDAQYIGAGGGGGSIVFRSKQDLDTYEITSFILRGTDQELGSEYEVGNIPVKTMFEMAEDETKVKDETYHAGKGGNGGGGAIIINW